MDLEFVKLDFELELEFPKIVYITIFKKNIKNHVELEFTKLEFQALLSHSSYEASTASHFQVLTKKVKPI